MKGYFAPARDAQSEFVEKKSRFITHLAVVKTPEEAEAFVAQIKKKYSDARHNCWAYRVHDPFGERYSDDGEPQGTAGPPMLGVLQKEDIEDICVVVTRYFGGVLLGAAGLTRAYSKGCADGVRAAGKAFKTPARSVRLNLPYDRLSSVERMLEGRVHILLDKQYAEAVTLEMLLPSETVDGFAADLTERSGGKIAVCLGEERLALFESL